MNIRPDRRLRAWLGRLGFAALLAAVYFGVRYYQQRTLVEGPAPVLQATLLDGTRFNLAEHRGQPVLVYFWATWCPVCRLEQGGIESVAADHAVIGIAMQSGTAAEVTTYLRQHNLKVPVVNDPDGAIAAAWGVRATPTTFFVDDHNRIRFREVGYTSEPGLRLRLWLAGR